MGKGVNRILATQSPLPVYTPKLNRIEGMWSVLKRCIRQFSRAGKYGMEQRVQTALLLIDPFNPILLGEKLGVTAWETLSDQFDQSARPFHSPTCAPVADGSQLRLREAHSPPAPH